MSKCKALNAENRGAFAPVCGGLLMHCRLTEPIEHAMSQLQTDQVLSHVCPASEVGDEAVVGICGQKSGIIVQRSGLKDSRSIAM